MFDRGISKVQADFDYYRQSLVATVKAIRTFEEAANEKVHDMIWEVKHGERNDFDRGYLENLDVTGRKSEASPVGDIDQFLREGVL